MDKLTHRQRRRDKYRETCIEKEIVLATRSDTETKTTSQRRKPTKQPHRPATHRQREKVKKGHTTHTRPNTEIGKG